MRFVFCACAISNILQDFRAVDVPLVLNYVRECQVITYTTLLHTLFVLLCGLLVGIM